MCAYHNRLNNAKTQNKIIQLLFQQKIFISQAEGFRHRPEESVNINSCEESAIVKVQAPEKISQTFRSLSILQGQDKIKKTFKIHLPCFAPTSTPTPPHMLIKNCRGSSPICCLRFTLRICTAILLLLEHHTNETWNKCSRSYFPPHFFLLCCERGKTYIFGVKIWSYPRTTKLCICTHMYCLIL